ncbi:MAG TPA: hypothetical protein VGL62_12175 [Vicinamibacterales bacterium]
MKYRFKRHITNTLLYAAIVTAIIATLRQRTFWGAVVFAVVSIALLSADRIVENTHLEEEEGRK